MVHDTRIIRAMWAAEPADSLDITEYPTRLYAALALALLFTVLLLPRFGVVVDSTETGTEQLFV